MKAPTRAAWVKMLKRYETEVFNVLMAETLQPHEREALMVFHDILRTRASGVAKNGMDTGVLLE